MIIGLLLVIILALLNYQPGTILSGWDTIHSEFNVFLDLQRTFFGVWQEYRGVGVLDGMGHTADLVRQLILLPVSLLLPTELVRYISQFLWLGIGVIGMAWWFEKKILKDAPVIRKHVVSSIVSTTYLLNFGTITNFHLPLESFSLFYAFLPWCLWAFFEALENPSKKKWLLLVIANLLMTPAFYIPTIFIVYALILIGISGAYLLFNLKIQTLKKIIVSGLLILFTNLFWLLPFAYFVLTASNFPREAQISQMSSQETYIQNKYRGNWEDLVLLRGYYYDVKESEKYIMQPWRDYYEDSNIIWIAYAFAVLVLVGLLVGGKKSMYIAPVLVITVLALLGNEPLVEPIHTYITESSPFFAQVFRSPYTKFISPLILVYSFYIGMAANAIIYILEKIRLKYVAPLIFGIIFILSSLLVQPVFYGQLFASSIKIEIPQEYFELFSYFKNQPADSRIVVLPQQSYWGWSQYKWGYNGSGFIWWGLPQSTMDRAFDVWNSSNENFYWELNRAIAANDQKQFDSIMQKYRIQWLIVDKNLGNVETKQNTNELKVVETLLSTTKYEKNTTFGKIVVYKNNEITSGYVRSPKSVTLVGSTQKWNDWDQIIEKHGEYFFIDDTSKLVWQYMYPFASLFTNKTDMESQVKVNSKKGSYSIETDLPQSALNASLILDQATDEASFYDQGQFMRLGVSLNETYLADISAINLRTNKILLNTTGTLSVEIPKLAVKERNEFISQQLFSVLKSNDCNIAAGGAVNQTVTFNNSAKQLLLTATNNFDCKGVTLDDIASSSAYLVNTTTKNLEGFPLLFNWIDVSSGKVINTVKLKSEADLATTSLILPPISKNENLYQLSFTNHSYKDIVSINQINTIGVQKIPYAYIKNIRLENDTYSELNQVQIEESSRVFPWLYSLTYSKDTTNDKTNYGILVLDQAFNTGWLVIPANPFAKKIEIIEHSLFNNWANGWVIEIKSDLPQKSYIVYAPQLLAFVGYLLIPAIIISAFIIGRTYAKIK